MKLHQKIIVALLLFPYICFGSEGKPPTLTLKKVPQLYNDEIFAVPQNQTPYLSSEEEVNIFIEQQAETKNFKKDAKKISAAWAGYDANKRMKLDPTLYQAIQQRFRNSTINESHNNTIIICPNKIIDLQRTINEEIRMLQKQRAETDKQIELEEQTNKRLKEELALVAEQYALLNMQATTFLQDTQPAVTEPKKRKRNRKKKNHAAKTQEAPIVLDNKAVAIPSPTTIQDKQNNTPEKISLQQKRTLDKMLLHQYNQRNQQQLGQYFLNMSNKLESQGQSNCFQEQIDNTDYYVSFCKECQDAIIFHKNSKKLPLEFYYSISAYLCNICTLKTCSQNIVNICNNSQQETRFCKVNGLIIDLYKIKDEIMKLHGNENK